MTSNGRRKNKLESSFQSQVIQLLESIGAYVIKIHIGSYQSQGEPDIVCCYKGRFYAFELKREGEKARELQDLKLAMIRSAGGTALVVDNLRQLCEVLQNEVP